MFKIKGIFTFLGGHALNRKMVKKNPLLSEALQYFSGIFHNDDLIEIP
jgi:hypothetical protein